MMRAVCLCLLVLLGFLAPGASAGPAQQLLRRQGEGLALHLDSPRRMVSIPNVGYQDGFSSFLVRVAPGANEITPYRPFLSLLGRPESIPAGVPWACYQIWSFRESPPDVTASDLLCVVVGLRSASGVSNMAIRLNQSNTAQVGWGDVSGATAYVLVPLGTDRLQLVPGTMLQLRTDGTGGQPTCYVVFALPGGANSDAVCAIPGRSVGIPATPFL